MPEILSLTNAILEFEHSLQIRGIEVARKELARQGNSRIYSTNNEIYHLKFVRTPFTPQKDKQGGARELDLKLHFAMEQFEYKSSHLLKPDERGTMVGIDEDLLLALLQFAQAGYQPYIVTALARGIFLWLPAVEFYEFSMRYDTFIKFARSTMPVCYVPTGYFQFWEEPKTGFPEPA